MKAARLTVAFVPFWIALALASCDLFTSERLSNIRMATDETGNTPTSSYTALQTFCVIADADGIKPGTIVEARWFAVQAQGVAADTKINTSDYTYKPGVAHIYFKLATWDESSWPVGSYKVVLLLDSVQAGERSFTVH